MFQIEETSNVYCDALVTDCNGVNDLLFISLIGSDSNMQELAGRLSLPSGCEGYLNQLSILHEGKKVSFKASFLSEKQAVRLPEHAKYQGVHVFWSSKQLLPQYAKEGNAFLMFDAKEDEGTVEAKVWSELKRVSRLPLLDIWRNILLKEFVEKKWIKTLKCLGNIKAIHIELPLDDQVTLISSLVKQNVLCLEH